MTVVGTLFGLVGIATAIPGPGKDIAENALGGIAIVLGIALGAVALTNNVTLSPAGISYRSNFRLRTLQWDIVDAFRVSRFPGNALWWTVRVELRPSGYAYTRGVWGTKRYAQRLQAEFETYRAQLITDFGSQSDA
jgi:hypothetical protein